MFCGLTEKAVAVGLGRWWWGGCCWSAVVTAAVLKNCGVRWRRETSKAAVGWNLNYWLFGGRRRCTTVCHSWPPKSWSILSGWAIRLSLLALWLCWRLPAMSPGRAPREQALRKRVAVFVHCFWFIGAIRGGLCWWARRVWRTVRFESYFKIINNHYGPSLLSGHGFFDDVLSDIHEEVVLSLADSVGRREICELFPALACLEVL